MPHNYRTLTRDSPATFYDNVNEDNLAPLKPNEYGVLAAVKSPLDRFKIFLEAGKLDWGSNLKVGDKVTVELPPMGEASSGAGSGSGAYAVVKYVGHVKTLPGITFGVEIKDRDYFGWGTTNGVFQDELYFCCKDDCGLFLSLERLSPYRPVNTQPPPSGQRYQPQPMSRFRERPLPPGGSSTDPEPIAFKYKSGDRVVMFTKKNAIIHGTVRWVGSGMYSYTIGKNEHSAKTVGVETDVKVKNSEVDCLPIKGHYFKPARGRSAFFLSEDEVMSEVDFAGTYELPPPVPDHPVHPELLREAIREGDHHPHQSAGGGSGETAALAMALGVHGTELIQENRQALQEVEQRKWQQELEELKKAVPDLNPAKQEHMLRQISEERNRRLERRGGGGGENGGEQRGGDGGRRGGGRGGGSQQKRQEHIYDTVRVASQGVTLHVQPKQQKTHNLPHYGLPELDQPPSQPPVQYQYHQQKHQRPAPLSGLEVGSAVQIANNDSRTGVIKWIGPFPGVQETIAGLELDEPMEGCNDGEWNGHRYFTCTYGRGFFSPLSNVRPYTRLMPAMQLPTKLQAMTLRQELTIEGAITEAGLLVSKPQETGRTLGRGSYGEVVEVRVNGRSCAAKKLHGIFSAQDVPPAEKAAMGDRFEKECYRVLQLKHANIIEMIGVHFDRATRLPTLVMEVMDTSLCSYLEKNSAASVSLTTKYSILLDVASGLVYLHTLPPPLGPIVHRDLTANNILLLLAKQGDVMVAKIADLGQAKNDPVYASRRHTLSKVPGNEAHMPPEAWLDNPQYTSSLDIFSFGVVMLHTLSHEWPKPLGRLVSPTVIRFEVDRRKPHLDKIGGSVLKPLITKCLSQEPKDRPATSEVFHVLSSCMGKQLPGDLNLPTLHHQHPNPNMKRGYAPVPPESSHTAAATSNPQQHYSDIGQLIQSDQARHGTESPPHPASYQQPDQTSSDGWVGERATIPSPFQNVPSGNYSSQTSDYSAVPNQTATDWSRHGHEVVNPSSNPPKPTPAPRKTAMPQQQPQPTSTEHAEMEERNILRLSMDAQQQRIQHRVSSSDSKVSLNIADTLPPPVTDFTSLPDTPCFDSGIPSGLVSGITSSITFDLSSDSGPQAMTSVESLSAEPDQSPSVSPHSQRRSSRSRLMHEEWTPSALTPLSSPAPPPASLPQAKPRMLPPKAQSVDVQRPGNREVARLSSDSNLVAEIEERFNVSLSETWSCSYCTQLNETSLSSCEVCYRPRDSTV